MATVRLISDGGEARTPVSLRTARISLALLLTINLINYVDRTVLAAIEPRVQAEMLSAGDANAEAKMGLLVTAFLVTYMTLAPLFGWLSDRVSRWMLIGISVALWSLASGASGLAMTFGALVTTRMFVGVGEAGYGPAAPTIIADLFPVSKRGTVMSWFYMAIPVGSAIGYIVGGVIASHWGWRWAFYAVTPPGLIIAAVALCMKDPRRGLARQKGPNVSAAPASAGVASIAATAAAGRGPRRSEYLALLRNRSFVLDTAGMAAMTFAIGGISYWMPKYASDVRHAGDLGQVNLIFGGIVAVSGLIATLLGGLTGDWLRAKWSGAYFIVSAGGVFISCPCIAMMLVTPFPVAWIWIFLAAFFLFFNTGPSNTILANVTAPSVRATAFGLNILVIHVLGDVPAPATLGKMARMYGWNAAWMLVVGMTAVCGILWAIGARFLESDTRLAGENLPDILGKS